MASSLRIREWSLRDHASEKPRRVSITLFSTPSSEHQHEHEHFRSYGRPCRRGLPAALETACHEPWKHITHRLNQSLESSGYASLVRQCGNAKAISDGKVVHHSIVEGGLEGNVFLGNLLIQMYGNCGTLEDARALFYRIPYRNHFCWNIIIKASAQQRDSKEPLQLFEQMLQEGVVANAFIFASLLSACSSLTQGKRLHACVMDTGSSFDVVLENALISMYCNCGSLEGAHDVFVRMRERDTASWNAMIAGHKRHRQGKEAIELFYQMQLEGVMPSRVTFISLISSCATQEALSEGKVVHARLASVGFESDVPVGNSLINMYNNCGILVDARRVFENMVLRDIISWNAMIEMYSQHEQSENALQLFDEMLQQGLFPDKVTFVSLLTACASQATLTYVQKIHCQIRGSDMESDVLLMNALINMYGKVGSLTDARRVFDTMQSQDVVSWNAMIAAYVHHGQSKDASQLFEQMQQEGVTPERVTYVTILPVYASKTALAEGKRMHGRIMSCDFVSDVLMGTALLNMYAKSGTLNDVQVLFNTMPKRNNFSWTAMIAACADYAALAEGRHFHACIAGSEMESDVVVGTALVNMYSSCGSLIDAQRVFDIIPEQSMVLWTAIITAYAQHGHGITSLCLFDQMQQQGFSPDAVTFITLLSACSHAALLEEGSWFYMYINESHKVIASLYHCNVIIDLLGRVGQLDEAEIFLNSIPFQPTKVAWVTFLGACRNQGDLKRSKEAVKHVLELDPGGTAQLAILENS